MQTANDASPRRACVEVSDQTNDFPTSTAGQICVAYQALLDHWSQMWPKIHHGSNATRIYLEWVKEVEKDKKKLIHPCDYARLGEEAFERLAESILGGSAASEVWPNVPQHFKGDPRTARFITVLMNPHIDKGLQEVSRNLKVNPRAQFEELDPKAKADSMSHEQRILEQGAIIESQTAASAEWWPLDA